LQLDKTMVSLPRVEPGDQVYCTYFPFLMTIVTLTMDQIMKGTVMSFMLLRASIAAWAIHLCSTSPLSH
jgi:hypothetical protein